MKLLLPIITAVTCSTLGHAGDLAVVTATPEPRFKVYGWVEAGGTFNPDAPEDRQNFGRLFDDRSNELLLNQAVVTLERTLPSGRSSLDWGFKIQGMFGSDARFTHGLNLFDNTMNETFQADLVEAYLTLRLPVSGGSVDLKLGKFATLEGAETIDPRTNFFYSHTYLFNFGIPLTHTGALATWHATPHVDLIAGVTRGVNTAVDDNNDSLAFHGGIGLNLCDGKLTVLASTHIGPETVNDNRAQRYLNDITVTAKLTKNFTSITDLNFAYDAAGGSGYGIVQYLLYTINEVFSIGARGEIWRDDDAFYVASFAENDDALDALRGGLVTLDRRTVGGGRTTYAAATLGLNIKPPVSKPAASLVIRPELRYDRALTNTRPFSDSSDRDQFTIGIDVIVGF